MQDTVVSMINEDILKKVVTPKGNKVIIDQIAEHLDRLMPEYEVNTHLRICHFLAQVAHESDGFNTLHEYWGPTDAQKRYEGRKDLGNTVKGDGKRYMGRGLIQLTGRANYRQYGKRINVDLENNPELAADPENSVRLALEYWKTKGLNQFADKDDILTITKRINGGTNGFADRQKCLSRAKSMIPKETKFETITPAPAPVQAPASLNIVMAKKGDKSDYVKDLQNMLVKKGARITPDGVFGDATERAVRDFQANNGLDITGQIDTNTINRLMVS